MKASKSTILKAIRAKCLDCCCGEKREITNCNVTTCNLHPFRSGNIEIDDVVEKDLKPRKKMSEEHKAALKAGREAAKTRKND